LRINQEWHRNDPDNQEESIMTSTTITVIKGDGIGPAIIDAGIEVLDALGLDLDYQYVQAGQAALDAGYDDPLPQETLDSIKRTNLVLKGPVTTPVGGGYSSVNVSLRQRFVLYANVRPTVSLPGVQALHSNVDIITVRENQGGMYSGEGQKMSEDGRRAEALSVITREQAERIIRFAFDLAHDRGRNKVSLAHKANILKTTSGLFLEVGNEIAKDYKNLEYEDVIVDNCAMQLAMAPQNFDVIVAPNLFGDILSDLCAGLTGGIGLAPGANIGENCAMFEAVHGSAPDIAGQGIANPTSVIMAAALLLEHLEQTDSAERIRKAVRGALADGDRVTPDLGGSAGTEEFAAAVTERL
jgi:isocitrate dehydrogenase (NAD+)